MKKKYLAMALAAAMALASMNGCTSETTSNNKTAASETTASADFISKELIEKYGNEPFKYDVAALVELGNLDSLDVEINEADYEYKQEDFDALVKNVIDTYIAEVKDDSQTEVKEDSIVNVNYVGKLNGEAFQRGTASDVKIDVAGDASKYISGFTAALIGHKVGETFDAPMTFPETYGNADLAGKETVFTFTVNYIYGKVTLDTLTNEILVTNLGVANKDEFLKTCEKIYESQRDSSRSSAINASVVSNVLESTVVKSVPEALKNSMVENQLRMYQEYADMYQVSLEELVSAFMGSDIDTVKNELMAAAEKSLTQEMVMTAVADAFNIEIDEDEFIQFVKDGMSASSISDVEAYISQNCTDSQSQDGYTNLRTQFRCVKAMQELVNRANVISK